MTDDISNLQLAASFARYSSHDPRTQNGALLICGSRYVASANVYPVQSWRAMSQPPEKYDYIEHAERAVIYKAAQAGYSTAGATMYAVWFSCPDCARAIIASGVTTVVGSLHARVATPERWAASVARGESMLRNAGVNMRWIADRLGTSITFDGRELHL